MDDDTSNAILAGIGIVIGISIFFSLKTFVLDPTWRDIKPIEQKTYQQGFSDGIKQKLEKEARVKTPYFKGFSDAMNGRSAER